MQESSTLQIYNASAGSGKTFSIVKEYLKIVLSSTNIFKFQQILAVTFTNKAAAEMKERIVLNLTQFSKRQSNQMLEKIVEETGLHEDIIFKRSENILTAIFQNYSAFSITTIDSFTHKLIRTFAFDLKLPMNFDVQMDVKNSLNEAVDIVISKIGVDKELTELLIQFSLQKLDNERSWIIEEELRNIAKLTVNENHVVQLKKLKNLTIKDFKELKKIVAEQGKIAKIKAEKLAEQALELISNNNLEFTDFTRSQLPNHFKNVKESLSKAKFFDESKLRDNVLAFNFYPKSKPEYIKQTIDSISSEIVDFYFKIEEQFKVYKLSTILEDNLIPLAVLQHIYEALDEIKTENNILFNAEFNSIVSDTITNEPAPFIYERVGEKFNYYFIDEMQDTSELQWKNLIPLIENALVTADMEGNTGEAILVGDAKQSIYRWRGSKAEQFIELASENPSNNQPLFLANKTLKNLETNYRSYSNIIKFNNQFFTFISSYFKNNDYENIYKIGNNQHISGKLGGYVEIDFYEKEDDKVVKHEKILDTIYSLDDKFKRGEICVLVRDNKTGAELANFLVENEVKVVSSESLLLNSKSDINFIINTLYVIQSDDNEEKKLDWLYYLYNHINPLEDKHQFLSKFVKLKHIDLFKKLKDYNVNFNLNEFYNYSLYNGVEYILNCFNIVSIEDLSVQFLLDYIFELQQTKRVSISNFLDHWELNNERLSLIAPENDQAVKIMTIHKSKGLEFPVVIFANDVSVYDIKRVKMWYQTHTQTALNSVLINYSKYLPFLSKQGEEIVSSEIQQAELDNFNLMYVAFTRAIEHLYVFFERKEKNEDLTVYSSFLAKFLTNSSLFHQANNVFTLGEKKRFSEKHKRVDNILYQQKFVNNGWHKQQLFIAKNSAKIWDEDRGQAINFGNLIHEILAKIFTRNDIENVVKQYVFKGVISTNESVEITTKLLEVVSHPKLEVYYKKSFQILNEREIITEDKTIEIPDRIVINNNLATIIDYKTGEKSSTHKKQLQKYEKTLNSVGFIIEKKILVYIHKEIVVEEF